MQHAATPPEPGAREAGLRAAFQTGGELGRLMSELDWAATPLGPIETWPQSLISSLSILLASKAQIVMFWGPDYIALYNDAYAPTIGDKHPDALGRPASVYWAELWEMLEPMLAGVRTSGEAFSGSDYLFNIARHGYLEEVYFDISYDPVRVEDGSVGGVFCIVSETTSRVLNERRMRLLSRVNAHLADATDVTGVLKGFLDALGEDLPDLPFLRLLLSESRPEGLPAIVDVGPVPGHLLDHQPDGLRRPEDLLVNGAVAAVAVPLRAGGGTDLGVAVLGVNHQYQLDDAYRQFLASIAERLATVLLNAQVYESEHRLAATLQRAILPSTLRSLPGLEVAGEYLPATAGLDVGGDWYDALALDDGRVALAIGDVAGKGVQAATLMGQLRNALRAYLVDGNGPSDALARLNRLAAHVDGAHFATVLCALLNPRTGQLEYATAGHLPPLLVTPGTGARYLECPAGPPIGVLAEARYRTCSFDLPERSTLVLFTDGLVEERDEDLDVGLSRAAAAADGFDSAAHIVRRLSRLRAGGRRADDIAILAAQRNG
ncbi:MAG TPA: PP2C family protein-serine/threonine phosphatase [Jatrophihabitans sp.]|nr:PP2C family protein-serine/threonine phosphatase [Jatrophihabitans sp.]